MASPRKNIVDTSAPGFYHCTNRCVRRAFLCGFDDKTGKNYEHRKSWLENRMFDLCDIFSIDIYAYAIMDNHYHIVLYLDPKAPESWSDEKVVDKWLSVFPSNLDRKEKHAQRQMRKQAILASPELLAKYRQRLGDLSWFMRRLNEPLAKMSNKEDYCTGRFWQGRFSSQALLDEAAVLSCMAYVDLNPVRAKITQKLQESNHTSIKKRLDHLDEYCDKFDENIEAMSGTIRANKLSVTLREYTLLVEWAGKSIIYPNKAFIPPHIGYLLDRLNLQQQHWLKQVEQYGMNFNRIVGPTNLIRKKAQELKLRCMRGISAASQLYQPST